jgi:thiosulfate/3-mercaptopyruvate sulfurtransferase
MTATSSSGWKILAAALGLCLASPDANVAAQICGPRSRTAPAVRDSMLVDADWLRQHLEDPGVVILHVDQDRTEYDGGHLPGARFLAYSSYTETRDGLLVELPPVDRLVPLLESVGITNESRVVIYGNRLGATRLFFTLDYLGHGDRAALFDGGLEAWRARGFPLSREAPSVQPGRFTPSQRPEVVANAEWVRARLEDSAVAILDTRTAEEYRGEREEEGVTRPGHIPGAKNLDWTTTLLDGRLKSPTILRQLLEDAGVPAGREVVSYCRVGTRASMLYFVARYLGYRARLYDGSMTDWSQRAEQPVKRGAAP